MSHHHDHHYAPAHAGHHHAPAQFNRAFGIGIALNLLFVAVEGGFGWCSDSLALLADAGHNLGDVAGLVLAWLAMHLAQRPANGRYSYGWQRASIIAAVLNGGLLLLAMGWLGWEALGRLHTPATPNGYTVMAVAALGLVINGGTALLFMRGSHGDVNLRGAFLHMAGDALVSLGVVLGGALTLWQGWAWIDPVLSLLIAALIVASSWGLLRQALHLLLDGVPPHIDLPAVHGTLQALPGVTEVHALHIWATGSRQTALTAHLVLSPNAAPDTLAQARRALQQHGDWAHLTLQLEAPSEAPHCPARTGQIPSAAAGGPL